MSGGKLEEAAGDLFGGVAGFRAEWTAGLQGWVAWRVIDGEDEGAVANPGYDLFLGCGGVISGGGWGALEGFIADRGESDFTGAIVDHGGEVFSWIGESSHGNGKRVDCRVDLPVELAGCVGLIFALIGS